MHLSKGLLLALAATLLVPGAAAGAELPDGVLGVDPVATTAVTAAEAVRRDCTAKPLPGRRGVVTQRFRAPGDGEVTVRLQGSGDWDLAIFDRRDALVGSSAGFGGREVAQVGLRRGAAVVVQACRRSGSRSAALSTQLVRLDFPALFAKVRGPVQVLHVHTTGPADVQRLEAAGVDVTHEVGHDHAEVVAYGSADLARIARLGLSWTVLEDDAVAANARFREQDARRTTSSLPTGRTSYRTFAEIQAELKAWVEEHGDLVKAIPVKTRSFKGQEIQAVEISGPGDDGRPVFFLGAVHHAREWPAVEAAMEFGWDLIRNREDPDLARVLREVRVVIQPLTNPDGFQLSRGALKPPSDPARAYETATGIVVLGGSLAFKRKNCNPLVAVAAALPCELAAGVDPNRNYATAWGGGGASTNPNDQGYRGEGPFSEPEPRAVQELSSKLNAPVHMSLHNIAAKVLRPPGLRSQGDTTPDREALTELGALVAEPAGYTNEPSFGLYDTTGTTKDWGYDALGQYAYTVELGGRGGFQGPYASNVVEQYEGAGDLEGLGLRRGLINAALYTRRADQTSRLTGAAPAGATLRLTKQFFTRTSEVCTISDPAPLVGGCVAPGGEQRVPERLDISMRVPEDGTFEWWVNPSTRPFVAAEGGVEAYTVTCIVNGVSRGAPIEVAVARGETKLIRPGC